MVLQPRYSSILADILKKKNDNCICPMSFLKSLKADKVENMGCQFGPGCQFEPQCQFFTDCKYDKAKCTCYQQCTCGAAARLSLPPFSRDSSCVCEGICVCKSEDTSQRGTMQPSHCDKANCICVGACVCKSEEPLQSTTVQPPSHCNKANCICSICLCQRQDSPAGFLPTYFRDTVKREANMMTDKVLKEQCAEIKQLLCEYKENTNKELEKTKPKSSHERSFLKAVSISEEESPKKPSTVKLINDRKLSISGVSWNKKSVEHAEKKSSIRSRRESAKEMKSRITKKNDKLHKKEKTAKQRHLRTALSKNTNSTMPSRFSSVKQKPLRIRYYYSGSTEHYGVKLGHKDCVVKPLQVPKYMGWLWNIEDHSKGIRGRKGWPPGFIGKSIKNMIKVMKRFEESEETGGKTEEEKRKGLTHWNTLKGQIEEENEPREEPPLLHIHKKGKTYNITFCPKNSDDDIGPIPIPFTITEKKRDSDSESSDSTLEFELHSPKPRRKPYPYLTHKPSVPQKPQIQESASTTKTALEPPPTTSKQKKKLGKKRSKGSEENKILWEEQQTQIQNIT